VSVSLIFSTLVSDSLRATRSSERNSHPSERNSHQVSDSLIMLLKPKNLRTEVAMLLVMHYLVYSCYSIIGSVFIHPRHTRSALGTGSRIFWCVPPGSSLRLRHLPLLCRACKKSKRVSTVALSVLLRWLTATLSPSTSLVKLKATAATMHRTYTGLKIVAHFKNSKRFLRKRKPYSTKRWRELM